MSQEPFDLACDRLSCIVDSNQFQRLLWARTEAPMLARLVELLHLVLEGRPDFSLAEEGSTKSIKRYVLRIHGTRIIALSVRLHEGCAVLDAEMLERSKFLVKPGDPLCDEFALVDEVWMEAALQVLFARVYPTRRENKEAPPQSSTPLPEKPLVSGPRPAPKAAGSRPV